jgi:predicted transcriptional regulator
MFKIQNSQMLYSKTLEFNHRHADMRRSKLELYEDVLSALVNRSLTVDAIAYDCNMDCIALCQRLKFLIKNGLVEEKKYANKITYTLTRRGGAIFKTLALTKSLKKLQINTKRMKDALQAIPAFSEYNTEKIRRKKGNENY